MMEVRLVLHEWGMGVGGRWRRPHQTFGFWECFFFLSFFCVDDLYLCVGISLSIESANGLSRCLD